MTNGDPHAQEWVSRHWWKVLLGLFVLSVLLRLPNITGCLDRDSIDFVRAAGMGCRVNALDVGSRPIGSFLLDCSRKFLSKDDVHVSHDDLARNDVVAFRHYHPPLFFYVLGLWMRLFGTSNAALMMLTTVITACLTPLVCWAWATLFPGQSRIPGLLAGCFASLDPMFSTYGKFLSYHILFYLLAFLVIVFLARAIRDGSARDFFLSAFFLGLSFAALEYALMLGACCLVTLLLVRNPWLALTRRGVEVTWLFVLSVALVFFIFLALWPAGVLKLDLLKGYVFIAGSYIRPFRDTPLSGVLWVLLSESPVMVLFLGAGLVIGLRCLVRREVPGWLLILALFPTVVFVGNLGGSCMMAIYLSVILPYLFLLAGWALWTIASLAVRRPGIACAGVLALCAALNAPGLAAAVTHDPWFSAKVIAILEQRGKPGDRVLVSGEDPGIVLAYYLPKLVVDVAPPGSPAMEAATKKIREGAYPYLVLTGYSWSRNPKDPFWDPIEKLPCYQAAKDGYDLLGKFERSLGEPVAELYERGDRR